MVDGTDSELAIRGERLPESSPRRDYTRWTPSHLRAPQTGNRCQQAAPRGGFKRRNLIWQQSSIGSMECREASWRLPRALAVAIGWPTNCGVGSQPGSGWCCRYLLLTKSKNSTLYRSSRKLKK